MSDDLLAELYQKVTDGRRMLKMAKEEHRQTFDKLKECKELLNDMNAMLNLTAGFVPCNSQFQSDIHDGIVSLIERHAFLLKDAE